MCVVAKQIGQLTAELMTKATAVYCDVVQAVKKVRLLCFKCQGYEKLVFPNQNKNVSEQKDMLLQFK